MLTGKVLSNGKEIYRIGINTPLQLRVYNFPYTIFNRNTQFVLRNTTTNRTIINQSVPVTFYGQAWLDLAHGLGESGYYTFYPDYSKPQFHYNFEVFGSLPVPIENGDSTLPNSKNNWILPVVIIGLVAVVSVYLLKSKKLRIKK